MYLEVVFQMVLPGKGFRTVRTAMLLGAGMDEYVTVQLELGRERTVAVSLSTSGRTHL